MQKKGILTVISGPSGSGKGTVVKSVVAKRDDISVSVSATTRKIRDYEKHGVDYYFISREEFERRIAAGEMLEVNPYQGNLYGTPKHEVEEKLSEGKNLILEIDYHGALNIKKLFPDAVLIFVTTPNFKSLDERLHGRGDKVDESVLQGRLAASKEELAMLASYDYLVINEDGKVDKAVDEIIEIIDSRDAQKHSVSNYPDFAEKFFN